MATLRKLKNFSENNLTTLDKIIAITLGDSDIDWYDETKIYNADDLIIRVNPSTGKKEILSCKKSGATGPFDINDWQVVNMTNISSTSVIPVSEEEPPNPKPNMIWFKNMGESPDFGDNIIIIIGNVSLDGTTEFWFDSNNRDGE
ncbi:MAG TPA: hypothetical protein VIK80_01265 [Flavihumibacter sp.]|jgi:hypothetical protein